MKTKPLFSGDSIRLIPYLFIIFLALPCSLSAQQGWWYLHPNLSVTNETGAICPVGKDTVYAIVDNGKFLSTNDGGATWTEHITEFSKSFFDLAFIDSHTGYAVGQSGWILKTIDGGVTWSLLTSGTTEDLLSVCIRTPGDIWVAGDHGTILRSFDQGASWVQILPVTTERLNSIGFRHDTILAVGNAGNYWRSVNGGSAWEPGNSGTTSDLFSLAVTPRYVYALAGAAYPNTGNGYSFYSTDILRTLNLTDWESFPCAISGSGMAKVCFPNDTTGFGIASGLITDWGAGFLFIDKTLSAGQTWFTSLHTWEAPYDLAVGYADISFVNDTIGYALCGNNILKTLDGGKLVGIKEINPTHSFTVYPSPATSDIIQVRLDRPDLSHLTHLSVEISDLNGRTVMTAPIEAATQSIDISDLSGGVYFINLLCNKKIAGIEKFVITK